MVVDRQGQVLLPLGGREAGEFVAPEQLAKAHPLILNGEEIGLAIALKRPALSELEERYLSVLKDSWTISLVLAGLLAIPIGLSLGRRLTGPLKELTEAIIAMRQGDLHQEVPVRTNDELGVLSARFNEMSADLAQAYQMLHDSREQISQQAAMLVEMSRSDELTGLMNRRAFDEEAGKIFVRSQRYEYPFSLAVADIDHFKQVNDRYTHVVGDRVLRAVADLLQANIRETDLVARYGGEEFTIAFPATPLEQAGQLAERLRRAVQGHDWPDIHPDLKVTLSIGLSAKNGLVSVKELLQAADIRLYEAKDHGRNQTRY